MENSNTYTKVMENSNTYTKVQNHLIHALCQVKGREFFKRKKATQGISLGALQTILALCRLTIGFHLDERRLSIEQITRITGFSRGVQYEHLKRALKLNMITRYDSRAESEIGKRPRYVYSVNFEDSTWKPDKRATRPKISRLISGKKMFSISRTRCST